MLMKGNITRILLFASFLAIVAWVLYGCAATPDTSGPAPETAPASIQSIDIQPSGDETTVVEIVSSKPAPYTSFQLADPPRVVLDIRGEPDPGLVGGSQWRDQNVAGVRIESGETQTMTTRVVIELARAVEFAAADRDDTIIVTLSPKSEPDEPMISQKAEETSPQEPRIFFKPGYTKGKHEVLGVDFTMIGRGRSRLTITTDKKVPYDVERKSPKALSLVLEETTIPPLLLRRLDSTYFEGAVDRVKADYIPGNRLSFGILLREMVPFHVDQEESEIQVEFGSSQKKPKDRKMVPMALSEEPRVVTEPQAAAGGGAAMELAEVREVREVTPQTMGGIPGIRKAKKYRGPNMTMDFVNADVTNVLRLIGEVSNLNVIWGPEVSGKVSMRLKDVPWEQALDLILANNDLGKREEGDIIWVAPRTKIRQLEEEEKRKREEAIAEQERLRKLREEREKQVELETAYLPLDFANISDIKAHIEGILTERGSVTVDARTNTLIVQAIPDNIQKARKIVERFDTPVKQIMIEARIVDATTDFSRDLGIEWQNTTNAQRRKNTGVPFGVPTDATGFTAGGDRLIGGNFSSNAPDGWSSNLGFAFGYLTSSALGSITLNAQLALAESEGRLNIISAPKVIASNGEEAQISRGDIIYRDVVTADRIDTKELEAVLSLTVTPTVSFNDFVTMEVEVTDDQAPTTDRKLEKRISTKLIVKSGETIVIGGIYKEEKTDNESGIPWVKDVPLLGYLFKAETKTINRTELLIFLTPTVVETPGKLNKKAKNI